MHAGARERDVAMATRGRSQHQLDAPSSCQVRVRPRVPYRRPVGASDARRQRHVVRLENGVARSSLSFPGVQQRPRQSAP